MSEEIDPTKPVENTTENPPKMNSGRIKGRFTKGHKLTVGTNQNKQFGAEARQVRQKNTSKKDIKEVWEHLKQMAKTGPHDSVTLGAIKEFNDRVYGKAQQYIEITEGESYIKEVKPEVKAAVPPYGAVPPSV